MMKKGFRSVRCAGCDGTGICRTCSGNKFAADAPGVD
jgi:hypothetical protein